MGLIYDYDLDVMPGAIPLHIPLKQYEDNFSIPEAIASLADGISSVVSAEKQTLVREKVAVLVNKKFNVEVN